ncbi:MAG: HipA N-terminal domain-containing protein [Bacteroidales bacterium]|nr:HipA N-terminal domain-containing protein [Bacteroidales bacterium]
MKKAEVYRNGILAGILIQENRDSYIFKYDDFYYHNPDNPAISLTLPKNNNEYHCKNFFPFFFNMLSEGINKQLQCKHLKIDEKDYFTLLVLTARNDTIGAITIREIDN